MNFVISSVLCVVNDDDDVFASSPKRRATSVSKRRKDPPVSNLSSNGFILLSTSRSSRSFGASDNVATFFRGRTLDFFGVPADLVPTLDAAHYGLPGLQAVELSHSDAHEDPLAEPYIYHWPDGNASLARLLVRDLVPRAAAGHTMSDVLLQRFDYAALDVAGQPVRIRLNAACVVAANNAARGVDVGYVHNGALHRVAARHVVFGGFNMALPFIVKELAPPQAAALKANVKVPMLYVNVLLKNWHAWVKAGVHEVYAPELFFARMKLDYPVSMGAYTCARSPDEPIVVHCVHIPPMSAGTDSRAALRAARKTFFAPKFEDYEAAVKRCLTQVLGPFGFTNDDIVAITVNRWAHGYAYNASTLDEPEAVADEKKALARQRIGNIVVANSDAGWSAYAHSAVDEAARAVREL